MSWSDPYFIPILASIYFFLFFFLQPSALGESHEVRKQNTPLTKITVQCLSTYAMAVVASPRASVAVVAIESLVS